MALVGAVNLTYGHGHWSTLFGTAPASPATAGVPLPDGSRFVVELAVITPANVDNSPTVTWTDITAYVSSLAFMTGTTDGGLSRWPLEQINVTTSDLTALVGDFVEAPPLSNDVGPGPGSFLRWGIVTPALVWLPRMACIVETITDIHSGPVRGWQIDAYGTLLYYAPLSYHRYTSSLSGNINTAMATITAEFVQDANAPWPWAEVFKAQSAAFPTDLSPAIVAGTDLDYLSFLHRCADSQGMRLYTNTVGNIVTELWTDFADTGHRITDETRVAVPGHGTPPGTVIGDLQWKRSQDQSAGILSMINGAFIQPYLWTKWQRRHDVIGWPKDDLVSVPTAPQAAAMCGAAAGILVGSEVRCDVIKVDTAADAGVWRLLTAATPLWSACQFSIERRRPGTAWFELAMITLGVSGVIDFTTGVGRARIDYHTRILP